MTSTPSQDDQLNALADYLGSQRPDILLAWRQAADADLKQTTVHSLTRSQFNDHIPEVLDAFENQLRTRPGGPDAAAADQAAKKEEVKHGLHRWQQGYPLQELMLEWGHLQVCLFEVVKRFAAAHPEFARETLGEANYRMITFVSAAISESTGQYARMQQAEALGRVGSLEAALKRISVIEQRRAALVHEAVHDLGNDVAGVAIAAKGFGTAELAGSQRAEFAQLMQDGMQSVTGMLHALKELARLEAGRESRDISEFDAAALTRELGDTNRPLADTRGLYLKVEGNRRLPVQGDPAKVRRLVQNLLSNALKYTERGGVTLSVGEEEKSWWVKIKDTGPGLHTGPAAPVMLGLNDATASARESDEKAAAVAGESSQVLKSAGGEVESGAAEQNGEGIGLAIVKRLCELLDASLEMASSPETGTTFRVVLPRRY